MQLRKNLEKVEYLEDQKILAPRLFSSQGPFCYIWTNFPVVSSLSLTKNSRALSPQCQRVKDTSSLDGKRSAISLFSRFWRDWLEETRHVLCQMSPWTFLVTLWELSRISISDRTESATLEIKRFLPTLGCPVLSSRRVHFSVCVQSSKLPTFVVELSRCTSRWDYSSELAVTFLRLDAIRASFTDYKYLQTHYFNRGCVSWIQMLRIPMFTQRRNANLLLHFWPFWSDAFGSLIFISCSLCQVWNKFLYTESRVDTSFCNAFFGVFFAFLHHFVVRSSLGSEHHF